LFEIEVKARARICEMSGDIFVKFLSDFIGISDIIYRLSIFCVCNDIPILLYLTIALTSETLGTFIYNSGRLIGVVVAKSLVSHPLINVISGVMEKPGVELVYGTVLVSKCSNMRFKYSFKFPVFHKKISRKLH